MKITMRSQKYDRTSSANTRDTSQSRNEADEPLVNNTYEENRSSASSQETLIEPTRDSDGRKLFHFAAKGMHPYWSLPIASAEKHIKITNALGHTIYTSERAKRLSSNATLHKDNSEAHIVTHYGGRHARFEYIDKLGNVNANPCVIDRNITRRSQQFRWPGSNGSLYEWRYNHVDGGDYKHLVLVELDTPFDPREHRQDQENVKLTSPNPKKEHKYLSQPRYKVVAEYDRSHVSKTKRAYASGNAWKAGGGGTLSIEAGCTLPEEVVVATALMMLKREQDKLIAAQWLFWGGVVA